MFNIKILQCFRSAPVSPKGLPAERITGRGALTQISTKFEISKYPCVSPSSGGRGQRERSIFNHIFNGYSFIYDSRYSLNKKQIA
jgi:hypothetical protein